MKLIKSFGRSRAEKNQEGVKKIPSVRLGLHGRLSISLKYEELFKENKWCVIDVFDDEVILTPTTDQNEFKTYRSKTNMMLTCAELTKYLPMKVPFDNELIDGTIHIKIPKE